MKNEEQLKPIMDGICVEFLQFSKLDKPTLEEENSFFKSCYEKVKDYFDDDKEFFFYLNDYIKIYVKENGVDLD
jgi:hypothetical protein